MCIEVLEEDLRKLREVVPRSAKIEGYHYVNKADTFKYIWNLSK